MGKKKPTGRRPGRPAGSGAKKTVRAKRTYTRRKPQTNWQPASAGHRSIEWYIEHYRTH